MPGMSIVQFGVMGGRLLCFMVLGTADLSLTPVSRGHVVQKKKKKQNNGMCVCECTF